MQTNLDLWRRLDGFKARWHDLFVHKTQCDHHISTKRKEHNHIFRKNNPITNGMQHFNHFVTLIKILPIIVQTTFLHKRFLLRTIFKRIDTLVLRTHSLQLPILLIEITLLLCLQLSICANFLPILMGFRLLCKNKWKRKRFDFTLIQPESGPS